MGRARRISLLCAVVPALSAAGCGKNSTQDGAAPAGQVIAHVGDADVTIQELENEFRLARMPLDQRSDAITKRILGELVARKYLAQQAVAAHLDRDPTVYLNILRSREQVLAGAVIQQRLAPKLLSINTQKLYDYRGAHPLQFSKREMFNVEQIELNLDQNSQAIVDATKDFKSLDLVDKKLTDMGVGHTRSTAVLDSDTVPKELLAVLDAKQADDLFFVRGGSKGTFFKVTGKQSNPLTGEEAFNKARQLLMMDLLRAESEQAAQTANASTKFLGEYARIMDEHRREEEASPEKNGSNSPRDGK
jgi:EpsD family peptidyl-prolyl cis-trans isomerase